MASSQQSLKVLPSHPSPTSSSDGAGGQGRRAPAELGRRRRETISTSPVTLVIDGRDAHAANDVTHARAT